MGISGILTSAYTEPWKSVQDTAQHWKMAFVGSFLFTVSLYIQFIEQEALRDDRIDQGVTPVPSVLAYGLGGLLVGLGTKIGNGCTTGHGICGLGRLSPRSLVATVTFTVCSIVTTILTGPDKSWAPWTAFLRAQDPPRVSQSLGAVVSSLAIGLAALCVTRYAKSRTSDTTTGSDAAVAKAKEHAHKVIGAGFSGVLFAAGLIVSGMVKASKVHDFLDVCQLCQGNVDSFDPTLLTVLGSAIATSVLSYQFVPGYSKTTLFGKRGTPLLASQWSVPSNITIDRQLLLGASLFGVGWGLAQLCPGPALYSAGAGVVHVVLVWFPAFFAGAQLGVRVKSWLASSSSTNTTSSKTRGTTTSSGEKKTN